MVRFSGLFFEEDNFFFDFFGKGNWGGSNIVWRLIWHGWGGRDFQIMIPSMCEEYDFNTAIIPSMPERMSLARNCAGLASAIGQEVQCPKAVVCDAHIRGDGLWSYLRHHISLASHFAKRIERDPRFKLAAPPRFSLVCFTLAVRGLFLSQFADPSKIFEYSHKLCMSKQGGRESPSQHLSLDSSLWLVRIVVYVKLYDLDVKVRTGDPKALSSGILSCGELVIA